MKTKYKVAIVGATGVVRKNSVKSIRGKKFILFKLHIICIF